jgi:hypothetical protein
MAISKARGSSFIIGSAPHRDPAVAFALRLEFKLSACLSRKQQPLEL